MIAGWKYNHSHSMCPGYHGRMHPVVDRQNAFDLNDGVLVNHAKFGDVLAKLK